MQNNNSIAEVDFSGRVTAFDQNTKKGLVECYQDHKKYVFSLSSRFCHRISQRAIINNRDLVFYTGEKVFFKLIQSRDKMFAHDIRIVDPGSVNFVLGNIISRANHGHANYGNIIKFHDTYFVKEEAFGLVFPVIVSKWEIDIENIYKHNRKAKFTLVQDERNKDIYRAQISDRKYAPIYDEILNAIADKKVFTAKVYWKNDKIISCKLIDLQDINGGLSVSSKCSRSLKHFISTLNIFDQIHVVIDEIQNKGGVKITPVYI